MFVQNGSSGSSTGDSLRTGQTSSSNQIGGIQSHVVGWCQHCGYCPHCGRGGNGNPYQPYIYNQPLQPGIVYTSPSVVTTTPSTANVNHLMG